MKYPGMKVGGESKWAELIKGSTGVVNLAGPPISTRWTPEVIELYHDILVFFFLLGCMFILH